MFPAVTTLIPHRPPFLFVDSIVAERPSGLAAERTWRPEESFYGGHYPGAPITPGVLLCEAVFQTACVYLGRKNAGASGAAGQIPMIVKIKDVRFRSPVYPGATTLIEVNEGERMGDFATFTGAMSVGGRRVLSLEFLVTWKAPAPPP